MKFFNLLPLAAVASANQLLNVEELSEGLKAHEKNFFTTSKTRFGNIVEGIKYDRENGLTEKNIHVPHDSNHIYFDYEQQHEHIKDLTAYLKGEKQHFADNRLGEVPLPKNCH